jgi:D-aminopeptidase
VIRFQRVAQGECRLLRINESKLILPFSGGTGMITMGFKAGTGSASRIIDSTKIDANGEKQPVKYTLGALVQSNFGGARFLTVNGVPVGRILADEAAAAKEAEPKDGPEGSIIVVVATDAPLIPIQLQRIAKRATVGVARSRSLPYS